MRLLSLKFFKSVKFGEAFSISYQQVERWSERTDLVGIQFCLENKRKTLSCEIYLIVHNFLGSLF